MEESLPNKFATTTYKTAEQYLNPGKDPEPFDIRVDVLTGDGTILYSGDYDDCSGVKYSTYLNDNIAMIKFHPSLKSEFRDRFEIECIGVDTLCKHGTNDCQRKNYELYLDESLLTYKFHEKWLRIQR